MVTAKSSTVPAAAIGLADVGRIAVGQAADLALWSAAMDVTGAIVGGEIVFRRDLQ